MIHEYAVHLIFMGIFGHIKASHQFEDRSVIELELKVVEWTRISHNKTFNSVLKIKSGLDGSLSSHAMAENNASLESMFIHEPLDVSGHIFDLVTG